MGLFSTCACLHYINDMYNLCYYIMEDQSPKADERQCPFCAEQIHANAKKCKHCGEYLAEELIHARDARTQLPQSQWSPGLAGVLSVMPGLGQVYNGYIGRGLILFLVTAVGYALFVIPGVVAHIYCFYDAYNGPPRY